MTDLLRIDLSIDKEFFKIKTRTNGPRKRVKELVLEFQEEYGEPPKNLTGLIEGVCE